ncbi:hypothetical protein GN956_G12042 [Arapaima gigas]
MCGAWKGSSDLSSSLARELRNWAGVSERAKPVDIIQLSGQWAPVRHRHPERPLLSLRHREGAWKSD